MKKQIMFLVLVLFCGISGFLCGMDQRFEKQRPTEEEIRKEIGDEVPDGGGNVELSDEEVSRCLGISDADLGKYSFPNLSPEEIDDILKNMAKEALVETCEDADVMDEKPKKKTNKKRKKKRKKKTKNDN